MFEHKNIWTQMTDLDSSKILKTVCLSPSTSQLNTLCLSHKFPTTYAGVCGFMALKSCKENWSVRSLVKFWKQLFKVLFPLD